MISLPQHSQEILGDAEVGLASEQVLGGLRGRLPGGQIAAIDLIHGGVPWCSCSISGVFHDFDLQKNSAISGDVLNLFLC